MKGDCWVGFLALRRQDESVGRSRFREALTSEPVIAGAIMKTDFGSGKRGTIFFKIEKGMHCVFVKSFASGRECHPRSSTESVESTNKESNVYFK